MINRFRVQLPAVHFWVVLGWVTVCGRSLAEMVYFRDGGKPSRHVIGHIGQLSFPSLQGTVGKLTTSLSG